MKNKYILMLGPEKGAKGGISSAIQIYEEIGLFDQLNIRFIATYDDRSSLLKINRFIISFVVVATNLLIGKIKLIHIHSASNISFYRKSMFLWLAYITRTPVIFHIHSGEFLDFYKDSAQFKKTYIKSTLMHSTKIVALTKTWKKRLNEIVDNDKKIVILSNPIDEKHYEISKYSRKKGNQGVFKLLFLGKICRKKGIYDLADAIYIVAKEQPNIQLCYGGIGEIDEFKAYIKNKGIENKFHYLGWITEKQKINAYRDANVFVLPSYYEGQPMTILEAMASGIAIISTNIGGIPDSVRNNEEAILLKPGDVEALANAINELSQNDAKRNRIAQAARLRLNKEYSSNTLSSKLKKIYNNCLRL